VGSLISTSGVIAICSGSFYKKRNASKTGWKNLYRLHLWSRPVDSIFFFGDEETSESESERHLRNAYACKSAGRLDAKGLAILLRPIKAEHSGLGDGM